MEGADIQDSVGGVSWLICHPICASCMQWVDSQTRAPRLSSDEQNRYLLCKVTRDKLLHSRYRSAPDLSLRSDDGATG